MSKTPYDRSLAITSQAYKEAAAKYDKLYELAQPTMKKDDDLRLQKAFRYALEGDQEKKYKLVNVYNEQSIEIARIIAEDIGLGVVPIICALLYNSVTHLAPIEIRSTFGTEVEQKLHMLTTLKKAPQLQEISSNKNASALVIILTQPPDVALIKLAENLYRMRTLADLPHQQQIETILQTQYIYLPIAHRLGLDTIKAALEDLHFELTDTHVYRAIQDQLESSSHERDRLIQRFIRPIQELLKRRGFAFVIKNRTKSITSIWSKMNNLVLPIEQIYDIFAIRIILDIPKANEKLACWQAYEIVTSLYKVHPKKFRNWLSYPRSSSYQALHATVMSSEGVWVEVQIRTKRMDNRAERGHAAHWKYKQVNNMEYILGLDAWLHQMEIWLGKKPQTLDTSEKTIDTKRTYLQADKIAILTCDNQLKFLPIGASVLDLAFALNTYHGLRCIGGKVNNKLVAYHHPLHHGDQVTLITAQNIQVLEDWLDSTVTNQAKNRIKKFLQQRKERTINKGKKIVQKQLRQLNLAWNTETINRLLVFFEEASIENLYCKLGEGSISLRQLKDYPNSFYKNEMYRSATTTSKFLAEAF